jgi:hypothetical protein
MDKLQKFSSKVPRALFGKNHVVKITFLAFFSFIHIVTLLITETKCTWDCPAEPACIFARIDT